MHEPQHVSDILEIKHAKRLVLKLLKSTAGNSRIQQTYIES